MKLGSHLLQAGFQTKKWCPGRPRRGIKLSPVKISLPPGEIFPVSPVATFSRTPQVYSNGTRWHLDVIYVASHVEK